MHTFVKVYHYTALIEFILRDYNAAFPSHCWPLYIYSMIGLLMWKYDPFWQ